MKKTKSYFTKVNLLAFILGASFLLPHVASGKSVSWNTSSVSNLIYRWQGPGRTLSNSDQTSNTTVAASGWSDALSGGNVTVSYGADIYNADTGVPIGDGSTISVGTRIRFQPKNYVDTDISWFGTGYSQDSPNGHWISGAGAPSAACDAGDFVSGPSTGSWDVYMPFSIDPPVNSLSLAGTSATLTDQGSGVYRVDSPGSIQATFTFSGTYGKFYYRYYDYRDGWMGDPFTGVGMDYVAGCYGDNTPLRSRSFYNGSCVYGGGGYPDCNKVGIGSPYQLSIPAQNITFNLSVVTSNTPPNPPSLTGPITGSPNTSYAFVTQASDPDNDTVKYGMDWDNNGSVDEWVPAASFVASNATQTFNHQWASIGTYTFKALAQDSKGAVSGWSTSLSIVIGVPASCKWSYVDGSDTTDLWGNISRSCRLPSISSLNQCQPGDADGQDAPPGPPSACKLSSCEKLRKVGSGCNVSPVEGVCGAAHRFPTSSSPTVGLCSSGIPTGVTLGGTPASYSWTCMGSGGGTDMVCGAPYFPPAPIVDLKINGSDGPITISRNGNLNITWGNIANAVTCSGVGNSWTGAKSTTGGSDNLPATAASLYTLTCTNSQGLSSSDSVSVTLQPTLKICQNSCSSNIEPPSAFSMNVGDTKNLYACYNDAVSCTDSTGDVTTSATWTEGGNSTVNLSGSIPKVLTASSSGTESIQATYSGNTTTKNITVTCTDSSACSRDPRSQSLCQKDTFTVTDNCGATQTCNGGKTCDYNWKEVAP